MSSTFLHHSPCRKCGSSDARGVFDDGHEYCWSCGDYLPAKLTSRTQIENHFKKELKEYDGMLPEDVTTIIPKEPYAWLKQYSLTNEEISNNNLLWSDKNSMLIFPFYGSNNNVLCWQGRWFPARNPKVYTSGYPDRHLLLHHTLNRSDIRRVVVVEDSISAIKVSRVVDSTELLGSNLSMHKAVGLSRLYSHLTLWLDYDKFQTMVKFCEKYQMLFNKIDYVLTELDPKMYNSEEIKEFLC